MAEGGVTIIAARHDRVMLARYPPVGCRRASRRGVPEARRWLGGWEDEQVSGIVEFVRDYPSKVAALFLIAPLPLALFNVLTGRANIPEGGAGIFVTAMLAAVLAVILFIAYRLWMRPSRRLIAIMVVWTVAAAVWTVVSDRLSWQVVFDVGFVVSCALAWNEDRVAGRTPSSSATTPC